MAQKPLIFSTTEGGTSFQDCEQSWFWQSLEGMGLENPLPSRALALGSLVHYTFADWGALCAAADKKARSQIVDTEWLKNVPEATAIPRGLVVNPVQIFDRHFEAFKTDTYSKYEMRNGSEMDDMEWDGYETEVGEMGRAIVANYLRRWGAPYPDGYTLIAPEQTIIRPLAKVRKRQRQIYLEGTLDQLLLDPDGDLIIRDWKTFDDRPTEYETDAHDQFMTYHWLCREEWQPLGYNVGGVIYEGLWKRLAITSRMRNKTDEDLQLRRFLLYSEDKINNHAARLPYRYYDMAMKLARRKRIGPVALDTYRSWKTCRSCSFADPCQQLLDGDFGEWTDEAEQEALEDYVPRIKTPAWRTPITELVAAAA